MHAGLELLSMMEAMEWKHLPVAGGLYDQHPEFVRKLTEYMNVRAAYEKKKRDDEERKRKHSTGGSLGSGRRGRRR